MSERTWEDIGNEIREDYLRADGPENVRFREVQWEVWIAEVERAAAEKAYEQGRLDERHDCNRFTEYQQGTITEEQYRRDVRSRNPYRAEAYRQERGEQ